MAKVDSLGYVYNAKTSTQSSDMQAKKTKRRVMLWQTENVRLYQKNVQELRNVLNTLEVYEENLRPLDHHPCCLDHAIGNLLLIAEYHQSVNLGKRLLNEVRRLELVLGLKKQSRQGDRKLELVLGLKQQSCQGDRSNPSPRKKPQQKRGTGR